MLASTDELPLRGGDLVYEPKYDGVRTLASLTARQHKPDVRLYSRRGNDKTTQFPEIARALAQFAATSSSARRGLLLDGEIVALDAHGVPVSFQHLQGRIHVKAPTNAEAP